MSKIAPIDPAIALAVFNNMRGTPYDYGGKAPDLDMDSHGISGVDCSGFFRFLLHRATNGAVTPPDGSQAQLEWAQRHLRKLFRYSDVRYALKDPSRWFVGFLRADETAHGIGHVWMVNAGRTIESYGSGGVNSRPWDTPALKRCHDCFELPVKKEQ